MKPALLGLLFAVASACTSAPSDPGISPPAQPDATTRSTSFNCGKGLVNEPVICTTATQYCVPDTFFGADCVYFPDDAACEAPSCNCVPTDGGFGGTCSCTQNAQGEVFAWPCTL